MGAPLKLTRQEYRDGLEQLSAAAGDVSYLDQFVVEFPDGLNTASTLEICRILQDSSFEAKVSLMRICIAGKVVQVTCPNGEVEKFCLSKPGDSLDGFDLFRKDPMALIALSDTVYGYVLKKSVRLSKTQGAEKRG